MLLESQHCIYHSQILNLRSSELVPVSGILKSNELQCLHKIIFQYCDFVPILHITLEVLPIKLQQALRGKPSFLSIYSFWIVLYNHPKREQSLNVLVLII